MMQMFSRHGILLAGCGKVVIGSILRACFVAAFDDASGTAVLMGMVRVRVTKVAVCCMKSYDAVHSYDCI